jgi:hypothetical protein
MAKSTPQARVSLQINEHQLIGEKRRGVWTFQCTWADLAEKWTGTTGGEHGIIAEFMTRALSGVSRDTLEQLAGAIERAGGG